MTHKTKRIAVTGKNAYAKELKIKRDLGIEIIRDWSAQLTLDLIAIILNDPEIMGHDVFGAKRLTRICEGFNALWPDAVLALAKHDEAEYWRTKIEQKQRQIFGENYLRWHERYRYWDEKDMY